MSSSRAPTATATTTTTVVSQCTVFPHQKSTLGDLKLSVSDLPMLACHCIQKGCLFAPPSLPIHSLIPLLTSALSRTLSLFPPLAGRLITDSDGYFYITCNDAGADFVYAIANGLSISDLLSPPDVPRSFKELFPFHRKLSYTGHLTPLLAVQVTELADGIFIGCAVSHAVTDGTSFWNFFNTFAEVCRGATNISRVPDFRRESVLISKAVLRLPEGGLTVPFNADQPLRERIFSFSRETIRKLKAITNNRRRAENGDDNAAELLGKQGNDLKVRSTISKPHDVAETETVELSSFQSLCALLWRGVTRARKLPPSTTTTFRASVNCRHRLEPKLEALYFGNAIQSSVTRVSADDVLSRDLRWCAEQLNKIWRAHDDATVRRFVRDWESNPELFRLGNHDGATIVMGSSPRFPMYDNNFGWGRPLSVRSGGANKFDGKISAFPGREGGGSVDLEVVLAPETMAGLESDPEFITYASTQGRLVS